MVSEPEGQISQVFSVEAVNIFVTGAPSLHLPIGQATDSPHEPNERIRLLNLVRGMDVMRVMFHKLADGDVQ